MREAVRSVPVTDDKTWYNHFYRDRPPEQDLVVAPEIVDRYSRLTHADIFHVEKWHQLIGDVRGKKVLYIACGVDGSGILLALRGGEVWVLDLAAEALQHQRRMGLANGTAHRTHFIVGSCAHLPFRSASFDVVVGIGIWHHLQEDLDAPCAELARVLKKDGLAVFQEPIERSRFLARLRRYVPIAPPADASPHCRPLGRDALGCFSRRFQVEAYSFGFLARFDRLVDGSTPFEFISWWRRLIIFALQYTDFFLLRTPGLERLAGVVVFRLTNGSRAH